MLGFVGAHTRVENVICDHRVTCSGNWEGNLDFRLAVWVHWAACVSCISGEGGKGNPSIWATWVRSWWSVCLLYLGLGMYTCD